MSLHYTADELLHLRDSPLVRKPDGLPPPEQWMGSPVERMAAKPVMGRAKTEDNQSSLPSSDRRSAAFDGRHTSRGSNSISDDIVLGPPKMSFASATALRGAGRSTDAASGSSSTFDLDTPRFDRHNTRDRTSKENDAPERGNDRARESRSGTLNGRRAPKEDHDGWTAVKPRKSFGHEDGERYARRNLDRERERGAETGRDGRERPPRSFETYHREKDVDGDRDGAPRRNGVPRGRNETSWFKEREAQGTRDRENKEATREREWRDRDRGNDRNERGNERGWNRGGRAEKDPEWMDTPAPEEQKQAHTAEDFQRWKERMKAGSNAPDEKPKADSSANREISRTESAPPKGSQKVTAPIVMDSDIDNFFGLWNEPKSKTHGLESEQAVPVPGAKDAGKATVGRASRFTSFFSPAEELPQQQPTLPPPPLPLAEPAAPPILPKDSSDQDKEGFQRILQMLGGASIGAEKAAPQAYHGHRGQAHQPDNGPSEAAFEAPTEQREVLQGHPNHGHQERPARARSSVDVENMLSMPPAEHGAAPPMPASRDNEFLLGLMHHAPPNMGDEHGTPTGMGPAQFNQGPGGQPSWMPNVGPPPPNAKSPVGRPPGFSDPPAVAALQRRRAEPGQGPQLTPTILQRPPGFEQMLPGWPAGQPPPGQPRPVLPPPGFSQDGTPGHPFPPFLPPPNGMPFFRNPPGPGGPGMPPAMPPPPGFFGMNMPPPGYPPIPFQQDSMMGMPGLGDPRARAGAPPFDPYAGEPNQAGRGRGAPPGL